MNYSYRLISLLVTWSGHTCLFPHISKMLIITYNWMSNVVVMEWKNKKIPHCRINFTTQLVIRKSILDAIQHIFLWKMHFNKTEFQYNKITCIWPLCISLWPLYICLNHIDNGEFPVFFITTAFSTNQYRNSMSCYNCKNQCLYSISKCLLFFY